MKPTIEFFLVWISEARVQWTRGDPMLMGAAIAYNSLFALVPLGIAFASIVTLLDLTGSARTGLVDLINRFFPPDIAEFLVNILAGSSALVGDDQTLVLIISIAVALWSGSRAVYAVQKSLRLVQAVPDERGYLRARFTGIAVTVGAGVSVMAGYTLWLFGENLWDWLTDLIGITSLGIAQMILSALLVGWVYALLWIVYRFGPPNPVRHTVVVAASVTAVLFLGSWFAFTLLPEETTSAAAVFGALGVVLLLLYFVGVTIVATPILVNSGWDALTQTRNRYAQKDERDAIESEGSPQRDASPRKAAE